MGSTESRTNKKKYTRLYASDGAVVEANALCQMLERAKVKFEVTLVERKIPATPDFESVFQVAWEV